MNYVGGIEGMNFTPITEYNKYLKANAAFEFDSSVDFENVLNKQTEKMQQAPKMIKGGLEVTMNMDDFAPQSSTGNINSVGSLTKSLGSAFSGGLNSVNNAKVAADQAQEAFAMGEDVSVHDVMIATEKANLSLQMAMQLRNKIMAAYSEINNIRV